MYILHTNKIILSKLASTKESKKDILELKFKRNDNEAIFKGMSFNIIKL